MTWLDRVHELDELDVARALGVPPGRSGRGGLMAAILLAFLAIPGAAWARPTHGAIQPLDAGAELAGGDYDPVPVGRSWTYREPQSGARYRRLVVRGVTMLNRGDRPADVLRTREVYALDAAEPKLTERMVLDPEAAEGVAVLAAEVLATGLPAVALPEPVVEMPRHLRADTAWKAWGVPARVLGLADVTVQAGDFASCLVIEETGGHKLLDGTKADVRRFFAPAVGEVLALVLAGGAWRPARELESVGAYPATTTTLQPAPKPAGPKAP